MANLQNNFDLPVDDLAGLPEMTEAEIQAAIAAEAAASSESAAIAWQQQRARDAAAAFRSQGIYAFNPIQNVEESTEKAVADLGPGFSFTKSSASSAPILSPTGTTYSTAGSLTSSQQSITNPYDTTTQTAIQTKAELGAGGNSSNDYKVTLTDGELTVVFEIMPSIVENRNVQYEPVAPPQFPGAFQKYRGTDSTTWTINATLAARTSIEARDNYKYLQTLRGWTMPFFGHGTASSTKYKSKLGAPPPVLKFRALRKGIIEQVPVVITSLNWDWPRDVDYLQVAADGATVVDQNNDSKLTDIPFPAVMQVAISLVESFSISEFNGFNLEQFYAGNMIDAFKPYNVQPNDNRRIVPTPQEAQTIDPPGSFNNAETAKLLRQQKIASASSFDTAEMAKFKRQRYVPPRRGGTRAELEQNDTIYVAGEEEYKKFKAQGGN